MSKKYEVVQGKYVVPRKDGKPITLDIDKHANLLIDYCAANLPVEAICLKYGFSRQTLDIYKRAFSFTRNTPIPVTDEEVLELSESELAELIVERKALALERAQDIYVEKLKDSADKWNKFVSGILNPFEKSLAKFKAPPSLKLSKKPINKNGRFFVVGLNDLQIGLVADGRNLFRQQGWNTEKAKQSIIKLLENIKLDVENDKIGFEGCVVLLIADLFHGLDGKTAKGTLLEVDLYGESQCDAILEILYLFIEGLHSIFGNITIHGVKGNHGGVDDYPIMIALKNYFRSEKSIQTNIYSTRTAAFKISNTMVLIDHGASDKYKADIPPAGKARESYIQSLLLSKEKDFMGCNSRIFITGDKHCFEEVEYNDFEFIRFGALPLGDNYSDSLNLHSRARQNCLIIDQTGLKSVNHYYIDQYV